jgi:hypothetical protein
MQNPEEADLVCVDTKNLVKSMYPASRDLEGHADREKRGGFARSQGWSERVTTTKCGLEYRKGGGLVAVMAEGLR